MKKHFFIHWLISSLIFIVTACAAPAATRTATPVPTQEASPTAETLIITPVESAFAPGDPTAAPLDDILTTHSVTFDTEDGATIKGELYGTGRTAVIFSVMGNCKPGWREFAQLTAAQGHMALTYQWRGCKANSVDQALIQKFLEDTRAAITLVREQGAEKIILVGASLGGAASAKLAVESQASGLVVVASPPSISQWGFEIESADLNTDIPKLFITAENDNTVPAAATRALFDLAAEPREWQTYPGSAHGTDLFEGQSSAELQQRILEFILKIEAGG
ncbi:MAG TPA: alpha/beta fold hydrolase [Anaerolineales bacterium]|nr:alpha/beta fold hydrolase [Anaerolineales bacterium]